MKILSISDVITNSSSEVFVLQYPLTLDSEDENSCISNKKIDWDFILDEDEYNMVVDICNLDKSEVFTFVENQTNKSNYWDITYNGKLGHWEDPNQEDWITFCELHKKEIQELVDNDLYFVEIEDHFDNCYDIMNNTRGKSLWYECRR